LHQVVLMLAAGLQRLVSRRRRRKRKRCAFTG
jgi:hypothetical protein